ncbi:MAG: hypothetical protein KGJ90_02080 [Patescibacteria group bacterium]|nr:hypothetical protein [Patescibacteria group bacterium]
MKKTLSVLFVAILATFLATLNVGEAHAQVSGSLWKVSANQLFPVNSSWGITVPSLANLSCIGTNGSGVFGVGTCGGGSGVWPFTTGLTNFGTSTQATTTPEWFKMGLYASSTSQFDNASTTRLTVSTKLYTPLLASPSGDLTINSGPGATDSTRINANAAVYITAGAATGNVQIQAPSGAILLVTPLRFYDVTSNFSDIQDTSALTASRTTFWGNYSGTPAFGSYTTGFDNGFLPFGSSGLLATSSNLSFDGAALQAKYASTTQLSATSLCLSTDCRTAWPSSVGTGLATSSPVSAGNLLVYSATGAGSAFGVSTSTLTASSPLTGSFTQIGSGGSLGIQAANASQNGYLSSTDYGLLHTATTTFSAPLVYTLSTNAVTCTNASSGVTGCMSANDWGLLHTATTTFSSPLVYTLGTNAVTCPSCNTSNATVSSIGTTWPITGGTITTTGTIAWNGLSTSTNPTIGDLPYWTAANKIGDVATSAATLGTEFTYTGGTWGSFVGGAAATLDIANGGISNTMLANNNTTVNGQTCTLGSSCTIASTTLLTNNNTFSGVDVFSKLLNLSATTSAPVLSTDSTGNIVSTTSLSTNYLSANTISGVKLGSNLNSHSHDSSLNGTSYNGSAAVSDWGINLSNANSWTGRQNFNNSTSTLGTITTGWATNFYPTYASSTQITTGALVLTGLTGQSCLGTDANGNVQAGACGGGSGAWPWVSGTTWATVTNSTTTPEWLKGSPYSLFASSTAILTNATTSQLTVFGSAWLPGTTNAVLGTDQNGLIAATSSFGANYITGALGTVSAGGALTGGGTLTRGGTVTLTCPTANGTTNGCIGSTDWQAFNMKVATGSAPTLGQLAYWGNPANLPTLFSVATTAVGCSGNISCTGFNALGSASTISFTGTLGISSGGTNSSSFNQPMLIAYNGTSLVGTSSPSVSVLYATSTTATSTFAGDTLFNQYLQAGSTTCAQTNSRGLFQICGSDTTDAGVQAGISNKNSGTSSYSFFFFNNDAAAANDSTHYGGFQYNSTNYSKTSFGTAIAVPQQFSMWATDGPLTFLAASSTSANSYINFLTRGSATGNEVMRLDGAARMLIGTTTPAWSLLTIGTSSKPQVTLSDNSGGNNWFMRWENNTFYMGTSTVSGTSTPAALTFDTSQTGGSLSVGSSSPTFAAANGLVTIGGKAITSGSTTISTGQIQIDGYNTAGTRVCVFVVNTTLTVGSGACTQ